jgi:hypothetical protein
MATQPGLLNKVFILSLGQFVHSDEKKSVVEFSKILAKQSRYFPYFSKARVYFSLFLDVYWYGTIDKYKKGLITYEVFQEKLSNQLGIKTDTESFDEAWKAMCEVSVDAAKRILNVMKLQRDVPFTLVIVTSSNEAQYDYIMDQIDSELGKGLEALPRIVDNPFIKIIKSFDKGQLSLPSLARSVIQEHKLDVAGNNIISLHNKLTKQSLGIKAAEFNSSYASSKPMSWCDRIEDVIKPLVKRVTPPQHQQGIGSHLSKLLRSRDVQGRDDVQGR